jgi:hypothetical protein
MLDYLATHPDATIRYHASDMVLHIHSDASYLSVSNTCSRLGGLFFLGNKSPVQETLSGSILNVAAVIKNVVASAAESEAGACFHNAQSGAPFRVTLTELGHTQPPTPLWTDNYTAFGIVNETIKQKLSKQWIWCGHMLWPIPKWTGTSLENFDVIAVKNITEHDIPVALSGLNQTFSC